MTKITAIIPTLNEEVHIANAIKSVHFADEIIIIDSYSTDRTLEIAEKFNVKIIKRKFDDFSSQKNFAIRQAKNDWIFLLDADEEVTDELREEIKLELQKNTKYTSYYIYRNFFFKKKRLKYSGWQRDKVIRLFHKEYNSYLGKVHEKINSKGNIGFLKARLKHYSYLDYYQYKRKLQKYAKLQALELFEKKKSINLYHIVLKPIIRFFIHYIVKLGILDGYEGLVISYLHAYGVFKRYTEFLKLKNNKKIKISDTSQNKTNIIGYDAKRLFHNSTGLGNYSRDLLRILSTSYSDFSFFLYNPKRKKIDRLKGNYNLVEKLPSTFFGKKFSSIWRQGAIVKQLEKDNVQIFHGLSGEIPKGIEKTKIKTVVTIHDLIFIRYPKLYSFIDRKIHLSKVKFSAQNANKIIAISEQTKRDIVNFLQIDKNRVEVIYQGCHQSFKEEKTEEYKRTVINKFHLPNDFILNVGAINERKNILSLIKSIEKVDTTLIIVGAKTSYFNVVNSYVNDNNLQHKVKFLEGVSMVELSTIYQLATLFVYPSIFEGFGIPIIEALYSKTPVITSTGSCFSEAGGPNSIYVEPTDVQGLTSKIKLVLENKELRKQMIESGYSFVQKFNDKNIATAYAKVYAELGVTSNN